MADALTHREAAQAALDAGDKALANEHYLSELQALGQQPAGTHQFAPVELKPEGRQAGPVDVSPEALEQAESALWDELEGQYGDPWADEVSLLREDWGSESVANFALAKAVVEDNPELERLAVRYGLDSPGWLAMASKVARLSGYRYDRAGVRSQQQQTKRETTQMSATDDYDEALEDELEALRGEIAKAQSAGNSKKANRLYQKEQALIAQRKGNAPIVGSGGRTA